MCGHWVLLQMTYRLVSGSTVASTPRVSIGMPGVALHREVAAYHVRRLGECRVDVADVHVEGAGQVGVEVVVEAGRAGRQRSLGVRDHVERLEVELGAEGCRAVFGLVARLGHHHGDRLADEADFFVRER